MWRAGRLILPLQNKFPAPAGWCQPSPEALYSSLLCPSPCMWCQVRLEGSSSNFGTAVYLYSRIKIFLSHRDLASFRPCEAVSWEHLEGRSLNPAQLSALMFGNEMMTFCVLQVDCEISVFRHDTFRVITEQHNSETAEETGSQNIFHIRLDAALLLAKKSAPALWIHCGATLATTVTPLL